MPLWRFIDWTLQKLSALHTRLESSPKLAATIIVIFFSSLAVLLQRGQAILDPDAFYHAKMAVLMAQGGIVKDFSWLPLTLLATSYADHHFLYHVLLIPFVTWFDPMMGVKMAAGVLSVLTLLVFFWTLRRLSIRGAIWWTLLAGTSWPFLFRLELVKALPLSLILYCGGLVCLRERRAGWLALLSGIFVWTYGGWPLLPFTCLLALGVSVLIARDSVAQNARLAMASVGGAVLGVVVNPYFPENLKFFWRQIAEIALVPPLELPVGQEWYPYDVRDLYVSAAPLFLFAMILLALVFLARMMRQRLTPPSIAATDKAFGTTLSIVGITLFIFTLVARRYVEYFIPLGYVAVAWWGSALRNSIFLQPFYGLFHETTRLGQRFRAALLLAVFTVTIYSARATVAIYDLFQKDEITTTYLQTTAHWMANNLPPQTLVINTRWDHFPALFYYNDTSHYAIGLDTRFFTKADDALAWQALADGKDATAAITLRERLQTSYILVSGAQSQPSAKALQDQGFTIAHQDTEATLYVAP